MRFFVVPPDPPEPKGLNGVQGYVASRIGAMTSAGHCVDDDLSMADAVLFIESVPANEHAKAIVANAAMRSKKMFLDLGSAIPMELSYDYVRDRLAGKIPDVINTAREFS